MALYLLDYGAGNVQSLANSLTSLGHSFQWIRDPADFDKADSLIFPGVGAFETAIAHLTSRGLLEPLRAYVRSGKPYFGICIGMQVLFESSAEATSRGLGIVPCPIERFDDADKAVPHMGWNAADLTPNHDPEGISQSSYYYFVHSYCAKYSPTTTNPAVIPWIHSTTQYGQELFISSVRQGNVFATQFHPEKSGKAGLALLDAWIRKPLSEHTHAPGALPFVRTPAPKHKLTKRVIACMDVRANDQGDLVVTKGDQYDVREKAVAPSSSTTVETAGAVRNLGKPVALAARYFQAGADEICLLNITSFRQSPLQDQPMLAVVRTAAESIFVPLTIGGGIKDTVDPDGTPRSALEVASAYFRAGADKVSIGSEAVYAAERLRADVAAGKAHDASKTAIGSIAAVYGKQAVVVSIDPRRAYVDPATYDGPRKSELVYGAADSPVESERGRAWWYQCTVSGGRENRDLSVIELAKGVETLGAGEILVNSIDRDGTGLGFDAALVGMIKKSVKIPVVASSGAGTAGHFVDVFRDTDVEAALAAGIFHRGEVEIPDLKRTLREADINVRAD
ncbi:hypothetical protein D9619_003490 [Psilocybe cf. subviscida]|uniref:Glutamine amidotransferase domain-containing protein n=1 Tax=Psilocybe cf. subviscida TaxID=2480587 RepID=A0A8H5AZD1_9AGAR|nr:hypothetical protein D9619_003490 [Psilocybe cf. subviscida]